MNNMDDMTANSNNRRHAIERALSVLRDGLVGVLYLMGKDMKGSYFMAVFSMFVDCAQFVALVSPTLFKGETNQDLHPLHSFFSAFQFNRVSQFNYVLVPTVLLLVFGLFSNVMYVGYCWIFRTIHWISIVRVLRASVTVLTGVLYMPLLTILTGAVLCTGMESQQCAMLQPFVFLAFVFFVPFALISTATFFDPRRDGSGPNTMPHARVLTLHQLVRTVLAILAATVSGSVTGGDTGIILVLWPILMTAVSGALVFCYMWMQPYYRHQFNSVRAALMAIVFWCSFCSNSALGADTIQNNSPAGAVLFVGGLCLILPVTYCMSLWRKRALCEDFFPEEASVLFGAIEAELRIRFFLEQSSLNMEREQTYFAKNHGHVLNTNDDLAAVHTTASAWYTKALATYPKSTLLRTMQAQFFAYECNKPLLARQSLLEAEAHGPSMLDVSFAIYKTKKYIEEHASENSDIMTWMTCEQHWNLSKFYDRRCCELLTEFWLSLGASQLEVQAIQTLADQIAMAVKEASNSYAKLLKLKPDDCEVLNVYAGFLDCICNDPEQALKFKTRADVIRLGQSGNKGVSSSSDTFNVSDCSILRVDASGSSQNGVILSANEASGRIFNQPSSSLVGKSITSILLPPFATDFHDIVGDYLQGSNEDLFNKVFETFVYLEDNKCIVMPCYLELKPFSTDGINFQIFVRVKQRSDSLQVVLVDLKSQQVVGITPQARANLQGYSSNNSLLSIEDIIPNYSHRRGEFLTPEGAVFRGPNCSLFNVKLWIKRTHLHGPNSPLVDELTFASESDSKGGGPVPLEVYRVARTENTATENCNAPPSGPGRRTFFAESYAVASITTDTVTDISLSCESDSELSRSTVSDSDRSRSVPEYSSDGSEEDIYSDDDKSDDDRSLQAYHMKTEYTVAANNACSAGRQAIPSLLDHLSLDPIVEEQEQLNFVSEPSQPESEHSSSSGCDSEHAFTLGNSQPSVAPATDTVVVFALDPGEDDTHESTPLAPAPRFNLLQETLSATPSVTSSDDASRTSVSMAPSRNNTKVFWNPDGTLDPALQRFRQAYKIFVFATMILILALYLVQGALVTNQEVTLTSTPESGLRRYMAVRIAYLAHSLFLIAQNVSLPAGFSETFVRKQLHVAADKLQSLDGALFEQKERFDGELLSFYEDKTVSLARLDVHVEGPVFRKFTLFDASQEIASGAKMLAEKPMEWIHEGDKDVFFLVNNINPIPEDSEHYPGFLQSLNATTRLFAELSQRPTASANAASVMLAGVVIVAFLTLFVVMLLPLARRIEKGKAEVYRHLIGMPRSLYPAVAGRFSERLLEVHDHDNGHGSDIDIDIDIDTDMVEKKSYADDMDASAKLDRPTTAWPPGGAGKSEPINKNLLGERNVDAVLESALRASSNTKCYVVCKIGMSLFVLILYFAFTLYWNFHYTNLLRDAPSVADYSGLRRATVLLAAFKLRLIETGGSDYGGFDVSYPEVVGTIHEVDAIQEGLLNGDEERKLTGLIYNTHADPTPHRELMFENGCLEVQTPEYTGIPCNIFQRGVIKNGLLNGYRSWCRMALDFLVHTQVNHTTTTKAQAKVTLEQIRDRTGSAAYADLSELEEFYIQPSIGSSVGFYEAYQAHVSETTQTFSLWACVIVATSLAICYSHTTNILRSLDDEIKRTRSLLCMIPDDILHTQPKVTAFLKELATRQAKSPR